MDDIKMIERKGKESKNSQKNDGKKVEESRNHPDYNMKEKKNEANGYSNNNKQHFVRGQSYGEARSSTL